MIRRLPSPLQVELPDAFDVEAAQLRRRLGDKSEPLVVKARAGKLLARLMAAGGTLDVDASEADAATHLADRDLAEVHRRTNTLIRVTLTNATGGAL